MDRRTLEAYPKTWRWVLLVCASLFMMLNIPGFPRSELTFGTAVSGISLIALYGLAYERAIWSRRFWRAFFWVFVYMSSAVVLILVLTVAAEVDQSGGLLSNGTAWTGHSLVVLLALAVFGVQMRGLYLYAYKRKHLWTLKQKQG